MCVCVSTNDVHFDIGDDEHGMDLVPYLFRGALAAVRVDNHQQLLVVGEELPYHSDPLNLGLLVRGDELEVLRRSLSILVDDGIHM